MSRHVVLLRRDPSRVALRALLHGTGRVTELPASATVDLPADPIDAVVIDVPARRRRPSSW